jgi:hypothetical protein
MAWVSKNIKVEIVNNIKIKGRIIAAPKTIAPQFFELLCRE